MLWVTHLLSILPRGGRVGIALVLLLLLLLWRHPTRSAHHTLGPVTSLHSGATHPRVHALRVAPVLLLLRGRRRPVVPTRPHFLVPGIPARIPAWVTWVTWISWRTWGRSSTGRIRIRITNWSTRARCRAALRGRLLLLGLASLLLLAPEVTEVSESIETREIVAKEVGEILHHWYHRSAEIRTPTSIKSLSRQSSSLLRFSCLADPLLISW